MLKKHSFLWLLLILIFLAQTGFSQQTGNLTGIDVQKLYAELKNRELDSAKIASVSNLILTRDVGVFQLTRGELYLLQPVMGRVTGAVFKGEGYFRFSPPTDIERYQLNKFTGFSDLVVKFKELYLRFSDSTDKELTNLDYHPGNTEKVQNIYKSAEDRNGKILNVRIIKDIAEGNNAGIFFADINPESAKRLFFAYYPQNVEEVDLTQEYKIGFSPLLPKSGDLVCSFHKQVDYLSGAELADEDKDELKIDHYKMDAELNTSGNLKNNCEINLTFLKSGVRVLTFFLADKLEVSQVKDQAGKELPFIQEKDIPLISVILPGLSEKGQEEKLTLSYSGDVLDKNDYGDFYVKYGISWYPTYGYLQKSTFDLSFKTPDRFEFVTIGRKVEERKEGSYFCTHWIEDIPVAIASFNIGDFKVKKFTGEGIPEVIVYHNEASDKDYLLDHMSSVTMITHPMENIGKDVTNSLNFFQNIYGKCPFPTLSVTEMPARGGYGYSGLLRLSYTTYMKEKEGYTESFRAHEVSHQWWGHIVGWKTYHDQWLSEGLAEYSGALYAQVYLKDNKKFFEMLEGWRKRIMGKEQNVYDGGFSSSGTWAGPLWLGWRLTSSKSIDYDVLAYEKGAYVIHMLRNMLMDFKTMGDDRFIQMMKDYVQTHSGKDASTEDFKRIVDKHFGEDMSWFFNQWVYGMEIPTYVVSWNKEKTENGKFQVILKVKQENVSEGFKMLVPVVMNFDKDKFAIIKVLVDKQYAEIKLPQAPIEPKEIVFNPFYSVLCDVKYK
jgi:hypothetical protein